MIAILYSRKATATVSAEAVVTTSGSLVAVVLRYMPSARSS